jgi:hypothetical protein
MGLGNKKCVYKGIIVKRIIHKRAIYYTMDALLAGFLLIGAILMMMHQPSLEKKLEQKIFISQDILNAISEMKIYELNNSFITAQVANGNITDTNITIIEQAGYFWTRNYTSKAIILLEYVLNDSLPENHGITIALANDTLMFKNLSSKKTLVTSNRMISGVEQGKPLSGASGSAYLKKISNKKTSAFAYFGGFVGQGNISFFIDTLPTDLSPNKTTNIYLEGDFAGNFTLYINGVKCNGTGPSGKFITLGIGNVSNWSVAGCNSSITSVKNTFNISFDPPIDGMYVAGGFLRLDYRTDQLQENISYGNQQYHFPGIKGIANLYDSFYIPGNLLTMDIGIHFNSSQNTYLTVGERIIDINATGNPQWVILNNAVLTGTYAFDYSQLSTNTVPLRFASYNATTTTVTSGDADVVLISDFSQEMGKAVSDWSNGNNGGGCAGSYTDPAIRRSYFASCFAQEFVSSVLNYSGNRVWPVFITRQGSSNLVTYYAPSCFYGSACVNTINSVIDSYRQSSSGDTCLSCAVNLAYDILKNNSNSTRKKFVVLMTGGAATHCASGSCTSNSTAYHNVKMAMGLCNQAGPCNAAKIASDCLNCSVSTGPRDNIYHSVNRSFNDLNVTTYTIGFGPVDDCVFINSSLKNASIIGNGTYQQSNNVTILRAIYSNISQDILTKVNQQNQSVTVSSGNLSASVLYDDSYINFTYDPIVEPASPGDISVIIQETLDNCTPSINLLSGLNVIDAKISTYSGDHWFDQLVANGNTVFNMSNYFVPYYRLGDPFVVQVPADELLSGYNTFTISTGDSVDNRSPCSNHSSFIYTALIPSVTSRTDVKEEQVGCNWLVDYEDGTTDSLVVPSGYTGSNNCTYRTGNITYNNDDTYDVATYLLLKQLDFNDNGKVLVNVNKFELEITTTIVGQVPYMWGPSLMRVDIWQ